MSDATSATDLTMEAMMTFIAMRVCMLRAATNGFAGGAKGALPCYIVKRNDRLENMQNKCEESDHYPCGNG